MREVHKLDKLAEAHAKMREEEIQNDVLQDIMLEHQQKIPEDDIILDRCDHTPDLLLPVETIEHSDHRQIIYECQACGEQIEDIQLLDESDMNKRMTKKLER